MLLSRTIGSNFFNAILFFFISLGFSIDFAQLITLLSFAITLMLCIDKALDQVSSQQSRRTFFFPSFLPLFPNSATNFSHNEIKPIIRSCILLYLVCRVS